VFARYPAYPARMRLFIYVLVLGFAARVSAAVLPPTVEQALAAARIPAASVSIVVAPVDAAPILSWQADAARNPASVIKLVTTLAALETLGPAYTWRTEFLVESPPKNGRLDGPLYLRGTGDPRLTQERLWMMLRGLRDAGVREISGDLVLDRSAFASVNANPGDFDGRPLRPYNALPDALLFNFNAITLHVRPDESAPAGVALSVQPAPEHMQLDNRLRLGRTGECGDWREALSATPLVSERSVRLTLSGTYPAACAERDWPIQAMPPDALLAGTFRALWQELGGRFTGAVRSGSVPGSVPSSALGAAQVIAVPPALTLAEVVRDINKFSNNVQARQLYLTLGREAQLRAGADKPTRDDDAEAALREWQRAQGLTLAGLIPGNGSGLARDTRISAAGLSELLAHGWRSAQMPEFIASLPVAGVDGTMRKRGRGGAFAGRAHIKTGSLDGVKSLAGYVLDTQGRRVRVVFLVEHPNAAGAQAAMDALLEWTANGAR
jgi:serine-type D-Ala-D-Ala carboxypeptidase/endopeptidase (penicillin-binding protein 4)